ncbi:putative Oligopeptidase B [Zostera marina]|uniref:Prolyl endopeptidase n=1 Tax=Zostera marina TaxID=29655 RepID=A0A0K9PVC3_ZOSMR|nr:putative Oligopeptidase B [Zostera marina]
MLQSLLRKQNPKLIFRIYLQTFLSAFTTSTPSTCTRPYPPPSSLCIPLRRPPIPKKVPFTVSVHGRSWLDPYHWMSNTGDPDLVDYLTKENFYAMDFMADTESLRRKLAAQMRRRMLPRVLTPPERWGSWLYYQYVPEGKEYPILCRKLEGYDGFAKKAVNYLRGTILKEEILLDWNEIAQQFGYVHIGTCRVSPNHKFLAYTVDISGHEIFILHVKDLQTGYIVPSSKVERVVSVAWSEDNIHLLYTVCDQNLRPCRVFCKKLGSKKKDNLIFEEHDPGCCVDITSTKDGKFITINSNSRSSSEEGCILVRIINATDLQCEFCLVRKRVPSVQYFLEHHGTYFYILTNAPSKNKPPNVLDYYISRCRDEDIALGDWQDFILPSQDITFQDMDMFEEHLVLFIHQKGLPMLCSINMPIDIKSKGPVCVEDLDPWFFPMPSNICSAAPGSNHDFFAKSYRLVLSSPVMPDVIVDYNMAEKTFTIVHQEEVDGLVDMDSDLYCNNKIINDLKKSVYDKETPQFPKKSQNWSNFCRAFVCERKEVASIDGVSIPLTILYSSKLTCNGQSPCLLLGYGAYGEELDKTWCTDRISLLNQGFVIAFADVRGGGGGCTSWHHEGVRSNKLNSIYDFVACGKYLKSEGYVHQNRLCAVGFSAGGLLVAATVNMFPDLFRAVILKVPFLDVCNTMLDSSLPLTMLDYEEFGDPRIESVFEFLRSYSPYDNISEGTCTPSMLVMASFNDSRVGVWEAAKWVAKVRENSCSTCSKSVILRTNMGCGHFGEGGRYKQCEDTSFEYAFLMKVLGMTQTT